MMIAVELNNNKIPHTEQMLRKLSSYFGTPSINKDFSRHQKQVLMSIADTLK